MRLVTPQGETDLSDPDESPMSATRELHTLEQQARLAFAGREGAAHVACPSRRADELGQPVLRMRRTFPRQACRSVI